VIESTLPKAYDGTTVVYRNYNGVYIIKLSN